MNFFLKSDIRNDLFEKAHIFLLKTCYARPHRAPQHSQKGNAHSNEKEKNT
jgi:hypothetical protein